MPAQLKQVLTVLRQQRGSVASNTNAWRWCDAGADALGATVEYFAGFCVLNAYAEAVVQARQQWAVVLSQLGARGVYFKHRVRDDLRKVSRQAVAPTQPLWGETVPKDWYVEEYGAKFSVRLDDGLSTGLFLDQRENRQRIRRLAQGKSVLNLFAYTCSFSVAAALGGARLVTSVDLSSSVLARGSHNLALNGLEPGVHRLLKADCVKWVERALRRHDVYDLVVVDPPSFGSDGKSTWSVERDYLSFLARCLALVAPGGTLLCVTNHRPTTSAELEQALRGAVIGAGRRVESLQHPAPPVDCPPSAGGQLFTKSVLLTIA